MVIIPQIPFHGSCEGDVLVAAGVWFPVAFEVNERSGERHLLPQQPPPEGFIERQSIGF